MNLPETILSYKVTIFSCPMAERNNAVAKIAEIAEGRSLPLIQWDILSMSHEALTISAIVTAINEAFSQGERGIWVLGNLFSLLDKLNEVDYALVSAMLEQRFLQARGGVDRYIVFLETKEFKIPPEFAIAIPIYTAPFPTAHEISQLLAAAGIEITTTRINLLSGLTVEEIKLGIQIAGNSAHIEESLTQYKQRQLETFGLSFLGEPPVEDFGGLEVLREYLNTVAAELAPAAREYGIPAPKGCMLIGPPGVGKTLAAKIAGKLLGLPLISVSIDAIKGRGVIYFSQILKRIEACEPCIAYFDEIDKMFPNIADSNDAQTLGTYLTWLQEKVGRVFVMATLNRINILPPEVTRIGRFDKIFYVGFPHETERLQIIKLYAKKFDKRYHNSELAGVLADEEWEDLLEKTENLSGAELAMLVQIAASRNFAKNSRNIEYQNLLDARQEIISLFERSPNAVMDIINKSKDFAIDASAKDTSPFVLKDVKIYTASGL
jgi:ATP-dependent 26S proteasome regulatory subunit